MFFLCCAKGLNARRTWHTDVAASVRAASVRAARAEQPAAYPEEMPPGQQSRSSVFVLILLSWFSSAPLNHLLPTEKKGRGISCTHLHAASVSCSNSSHMLPTIALKSFCLDLLLSHSLCVFRSCAPDFNSLGE